MRTTENSPEGRIAGQYTAWRRSAGILEIQRSAEGIRRPTTTKKEDALDSNVIRFETAGAFIIVYYAHFFSEACLHESVELVRVSSSVLIKRHHT